MNKIKQLQLKQQTLDDFIVQSKDLEISDSEMLKNLILACHDEITEVEESPYDIEEWVDVLHCTLSIANRMGFDLVEMPTLGDEFETQGLIDDLRMHLLEFTRLTRCFKCWSYKTPSGLELNEARLMLCEMIQTIETFLDRNDCCMVEEYNKKHLINMQRQKEGY